MNESWLSHHIDSPLGRATILRRVARVVMCAAFSLMAATAFAQGAKPLDSAVKAVYLLNFGRFATWPPAAGTEDPAVFNVCVLGLDPFGTTLDTTVKGEIIDGRPVAIKRMATPRQLTGCRIVFMSGSEAGRVKPTLALLQNTRVLTVSDVPHFVDQGGMIEFVLDGSKVRFRVNVAAVDQAGLALSSELLRVAVSVTTPPAP